MAAYILKRLLLMLPTLLGVLLLTFAVIQFVSGGPVEQYLAEAKAGAGGATAEGGGLSYRGAQGIDDKRLAEICREAHISSISLTEAFRAAAPSGSVQLEKEWLFNNGRFHWNKRGNLVAAEVVCRYLADAKDGAAAVAQSPSRKEGRP